MHLLMMAARLVLAVVFVFWRGDSAGQLHRDECGPCYALGSLVLLLDWASLHVQCWACCWDAQFV